jgi:hypothetical protein
MVLLLPNALGYKIMRKYIKCYKQEKYCNAELVCEEANVHFTIGIKKKIQN